MKKILIIITLVLALAGTGLFLYSFFKPHKTAENKESDFQVTASSLFSLFENHPDSAKALYLNKILTVEGTIAEVSKREGENGKVVVNIMLEPESSGFINCEMDPSTVEETTKLAKGTKIKIKGYCNGSSSSDDSGLDLLGFDIIMDRCFIEK